MTARAVLVPIIAALFAATGIFSDSARTEEACLAAPNTLAPLGSHWRYRTDRLKQSKCWYLKAEDQASRTAGQGKPQADAGAGAPLAKLKTAGDPPGRPVQQFQPIQTASDRSTLASTLYFASASPPAGPIRWARPDPAPTAPSENLKSPDPSSTEGPSRQAAASRPDAQVSQIQEVPVPAARPVSDVRNAAAVYSRISVWMLLVLALALLIAGTSMRQVLLTITARRRMRWPDRSEPMFTIRMAGEGSLPNVLVFHPTIPDFLVRHRDFVVGAADNSLDVDEQCRQTLRKLLYVLEPKAA